MTRPVVPPEDVLDQASDEAAHAYPSELARTVRERWYAIEAETGGSAVALPGDDVLSRVLSLCYQASLWLEEGRQTTFRLALSHPEAFAITAGPPDGLHRLLFTARRPLDEHELRRLAPAAGFHTSLIGAELDEQGIPQIWGLIHSGPRWLQPVRGGREIRQLVPDVLMIAVTGPGRLLVSKGAIIVAELSGGMIRRPGMDVLRAPWMSQAFAHVDAHSAAHTSTRQRSPNAWAQVEPSFGPLLAQHVLRRILATIRGAQHGGALILLPPHRVADVIAGNRHLSLKYTFQDEEPRRRISTLTVKIINELARMHHQGTAGDAVRWIEYEESREPRLAALDEALFEVAHLVAALADVDGAVVMTTGLELLGFGGEIAGHLPEVAMVARAFDLDATHRRWVRTDRVGTRHRSAYRLCEAVRDAIVVVISQDGGMRFVRWQDDGVTYWDQVATGPWEV